MSQSEELQDFLGETRDYLDAVEPLILDLGNTGDEAKPSVDELFRRFHSVKGVSGFLGLNHIQALTHRLESVLDGIRRGKLLGGDTVIQLLLRGSDALRQLLDVVEKKGEDEIEGIADWNELLDTAQELIDSQNTKKKASIGEGLLFKAFRSEAFLSEIREDLLIWADDCETALFGLLDQPHQIQAILEKVLSNIAVFRWNLQLFPGEKTEVLLKALEGFLAVHRDSRGIEPTELSPIFGALHWIKTWGIHDTIPDGVLLEWETLIQDLKKTHLHADHLDGISNVQQSVSTPTTPHEDPSQNRGGVRVEMEKIDRLVDLIEELGVVTGVVSRSGDLHIDADPMFAQASNKLKQITGSLQDVAMSVRLVPLTGMFQKMRRLSYDVSQKLGKPVQLIFRGDKTEMDRNMAEALQECLVHLFRNAVDHGIESPTRREELGKSREGTIQFDAWLGAGEICLSLKDDGKGLDPDMLRQKAVDKGIIQKDAILSPSECQYLIFHPGFSTRDEVSDFSGRGVGMDVVHQGIHGLGGNITIDSEVGKGTRFLITIPMMSTIVETMLVRVGGLCCSVRIASVRELFSVNLADWIVSPDGTEHIRVRDEIFPLLRIGALLEFETLAPHYAFEDGVLLLVEHRGEFSVLFVDEILGTRQGVIKPLPSSMKGVAGISGCTVIGTHSDDISWILDLNYLFSHRPGELV
jgi:two-component system chemotaxis sensor kinase CheA